MDSLPAFSTSLVLGAIYERRFHENHEQLKYRHIRIHEPVPAISSRSRPGPDPPGGLKTSTMNQPHDKVLARNGPFHRMLRRRWG